MKPKIGRAAIRGEDMTNLPSLHDLIIGYETLLRIKCKEEMEERRVCEDIHFGFD